jgi:hypothetical protein
MGICLFVRGSLLGAPPFPARVMGGGARMPCEIGAKNEAL